MLLLNSSVNFYNVILIFALCVYACVHMHANVLRMYAYIDACICMYTYIRTYVMAVSHHSVSY